MTVKQEAEVHQDVNMTLEKKVQQLVSRDNISSDKYLFRALNKQFYIPIDCLLKHRALESYAPTKEQIVAIAKASKSLDIDESETMIRPINTLKRNTLILRDLPNTVTKEDIMNLFINCPESHNGSHVTELRPELNNTWFMVLSDESVVSDYITHLRSCSLQETIVRVGVKSEHFLRTVNTYATNKSSNGKNYNRGEAGQSSDSPQNKRHFNNRKRREQNSSKSKNSVDNNEPKNDIANDDNEGEWQVVRKERKNKNIPQRHKEVNIIRNFLPTRPSPKLTHQPLPQLKSLESFPYLHASIQLTPASGNEVLPAKHDSSVRKYTLNQMRKIVVEQSQKIQKDSAKKYLAETITNSEYAKNHILHSEPRTKWCDVTNTEMIHAALEKHVKISGKSTCNGSLRLNISPAASPALGPLPAPANCLSFLSPRFMNITSPQLSSFRK